jgi:hypothetical protein
MKKHIIGFALFSLIAGFALWFADVEHVHHITLKKDFPVEIPRTVIETENYSPDLISSKVELLTVDLRDNTINTSIKLEWNGEGAPPKTVYVVIRPFLQNNLKLLEAITEISVPQWENNQARIQTSVFHQINEQSENLPNYYAFVDVFPQTAYRTKDRDVSRDLKSAHSIVVIQRDYKIVKLK